MSRSASFALAALALAACSDRSRSLPPPLDRIYFPTGLALRHFDAAGADCTGGSAGCTGQLLLVSSNFDLRYDALEGGALVSLAVPPDPPPPGPGDPVPSIAALDVRGGARIGSLGGELAVVDAVTCPGWSADPARAPAALVAARANDRLYRIDLLPGGGLDCGAGCSQALDPTLTDAYGVGVACRGTGTAFQARAYVSHLQTPLNEGYVTEVDLLGGTSLVRLDLGPDAVHSIAYQAATDRLWTSSRYAGPGTIPFRWLELGNTAASAQLFDLAFQIRGAETRGFAISSDGTRAYIALRLYNADAATAFLIRPPDVGGAIGILSLAEEANGRPSGVLVAVIPVGRAPAEVRVLPRPGQRDLVAVSCTGDDTLWLYDDEIGAVVKVFASDPATGRPVLGRQPFGLAFEPRANGQARLYVGAFASHLVSVVDLDPAQPGGARILMTLGGSP